MPTQDKQCLIGYSLQDYRQMFALSEQCLDMRILDCAGGPSSFNYEVSVLGGSVLSVDPIYNTHIEELSALINQGDEAAELFLRDILDGRKAGRYLSETLPFLPFGDEEFELALCAHFLFEDNNPKAETLQVATILELCRVAEEVRVFPLLTDNNQLPDTLEKVITILQEEGYATEIRQVDYCHSSGRNAMLRVWPIYCPLKNQPVSDIEHCV